MYEFTPLSINLAIDSNIKEITTHLNNVSSNKIAAATSSARGSSAGWVIGNV